MSEITGILQKLAGTQEYELLQQMDEAYEIIKSSQGQWYTKSEFYCPEGCGECCRNFEPDILQGEALFMAAWLLENQPEVAKNVAEGKFPFPREGCGCQFWDENNAYHCTIYGGRGAICRLFGACGSKDKNGQTVFKPCKFYSVEDLAKYKVPLEHRQYSTEEIQKIFGTLPPVMSDLMERIVGFNMEDTKTQLIRDALPLAIQKLMWIMSLKNQ